MDAEFARKAALECGRRCMMHRPPRPGTDAATAYKAPERTPEEELSPNYGGVRVGHGEQVCVNRCLSKLLNVREVVQDKLLVEQPPMLFN